MPICYRHHRRREGPREGGKEDRIEGGADREMADGMHRERMKNECTLSALPPLQIAGGRSGMTESMISILRQHGESACNAYMNISQEDVSQLTRHVQL